MDALPMLLFSFLVFLILRRVECHHQELVGGHDPNPQLAPHALVTACKFKETNVMFPQAQYSRTKNSYKIHTVKVTIAENK